MENSEFRSEISSRIVYLRAPTELHEHVVKVNLFEPYEHVVEENLFDFQQSQMSHLFVLFCIFLLPCLDDLFTAVGYVRSLPEQPK